MQRSFPPGESLDEASSALKTGDERACAEDVGVRAGPPDAPQDDGTSVLSDEDLNLTRGTQSGARYAALDPRAHWVGRAFGSFRIVRELASGGMASVFLARKDGPGRVTQHSAVKIIHPHLASERGFVDMFLDEARIVSSVQHPNVCRVLDFGTESDTYYLAMEYVLGETWSAMLAALSVHDAGRAVLPALSAYVLAQAADGLHAAHEATDEDGQALHIVHRDVSPQNIFVAYDGTVRVLDFGIARAADRITTTQAGTVKGRLAYMAPEQMEGKAVDARADIWSLGVVLREALEGQRLFRRASDAETMMAVTTDPLPSLPGTIAPRLREIVDAALQRDPAARYARANELSADLMRFCQSQSIPMAMSEVSAWMHRLFETKLEEKRKLLQETAPEPDAASVTLEPSAQHLGFTPSQARAALAEQREEGLETDPLEAELNALYAPIQHRRRMLRSLALVVLAAGAGAFLARQTTSETPLETRQPKALALPAAASPPAPQDAPPTTQPEQVSQGALEVAPSAGKTVRAKRRRERATDEAVEAYPRTGAQALEPEFGTLVVAFQGGWAEVYLGDKLLGTTPGRFSLSAGKHTLSIKPFGKEPAATRVVEVSAAATSKLSLTPSEL